MNKKFDIAGFNSNVFGVKFNNENEFLNFIERYKFDAIRFCNKKIFPQYADFCNYSDNIVLVDNYKVNPNYVNWNDYMEEKIDTKENKYFEWYDFFSGNILVEIYNNKELKDFELNFEKYSLIFEEQFKHKVKKCIMFKNTKEFPAFIFSGIYDDNNPVYLLKDFKKEVKWCDYMIKLEENKKTNKLEVFKSITDKMYKTYESKNNDYGDSFTKVRNKYPNSIVIRLNDKLNRLESLMNGNKQMVSDESIDDTLIDMATYSIMELTERMIDNECREKV